MSTPQDLAAELSQERFALTAVLEFARTLTPDLGPREIVRSALHSMMGKSLISEAFAYRAKDGNYELIARAGFPQKNLPELLDQPGFDALLENNQNSYIALPLVAPDGSGYLGLLGLGKSLNPKLSGESEATYLASLAALTSIALTNAELFEGAKERERLESELRLARDIQQSLLPQSLPTISGAEFAAISKPSEWVGGDYYDVIELGDGRVLLAIADVVGKGVTAALTMANVQAALRALALLVRERHLSLLDLVKELNRLMCENSAPERFITGVFAIVDVPKRKIESIVCGHPNPIILSPLKEPEFVESTGIPLGIISTYPFESREYSIAPNSLLIFYTDGLSEGMANGKAVGEKGVVQLATDALINSDNLSQALHELTYSASISIEDDITLLAVRIAHE